MLKNLLARVGLGAQASAPAAAQGPYARAHLNFLYDLLFCDDIAVFRSDNTAAYEPPWSTLLAEAPDEHALRCIADDTACESRVRLLAFLRLREAGHAVAPKILLGVIVEVPLDDGLDVLAAYSDGRVRYLNQTGKVAIFDGGPALVEMLARETVIVALPLMRRIGPQHGPRLPAPHRGQARLTLLVSDGLYFDEGTFADLRQDPLGGPVLAKATELLRAVVEPATN